MVSRTPSRTVLIIVAAAGILSATSVASAAPQEEQRNSLPLLAAAEGAVAANAGSAIPKVAGFYTLPDVNGPGLRVSFVQTANELTATWMNQQGEIYGRGKYRWDPVTRSFNGTSTTRHLCLDEQGQPSATVVVREELHVISDRELRDRWTKPLNVDCSVGLVEVFRWIDQTWLATDEEWKPLHPRQEPPAILVGGR